MNSLIWQILTVVILALGIFPARNYAQSQAAEPVTSEDVNGLIEELSNWGRWGKEDQLGTLNLITPEKRVAAAALVTEGVSISLSHPLLTEPAADNPSPFEHKMVAIPSETNAWAVDSISVVFHGFGHSHMDALCHLSHKGQYYNGRSISTVTDAGCAKGAIAIAGNGIFTRAVLMDIPRLKNRKWLEPGTPVYVEDLEAWEKEAGVKVGPGDAVLLRTGRWARRAELGPWEASQGFAGFHVSTVRWLKERDVAIVGTDGGLDVYPSGVAGVGAPVHLLVLVALGMPILDTMDFAAVADAAALRKRWEFLLTAAPLRIPTGTGSPLNPIATF